MQYTPSQIELMERREETPLAIQNLPDLFEDLVPIWLAFWTLHSSRPIGMSPGAIQLSEMVTYFRDILGVTDQEELAEKIGLVRAMDSVWMTWYAEKNNGV